jgi:hypothetical protein
MFLFHWKEIVACITAPNRYVTNRISSVTDLGSVAFLTTGSGIRDLGAGMGKKTKVRARDDHPGSYFRELRNNFLG